MTSLHWGLLSTAAVGRLVVGVTRGSDTMELVAVAGRDGARAEAFARANGLPLAFGSYEEMLALDAAFVARRISLHAEWTVKALEAGKHVLCEKPFVTTAADADPWLGVSAALELRRGRRSGTIPVDLAVGSRLGLDDGAVYRHELDLVSRAALSGSPLPFGRADAVAQAATLEALDTSARSGSPVLSRPVHAPSGPRT